MEFNDLLKASKAYGGIHVHDNVTAQSIPTGATYTKIIQFADSDEAHQCAPDPANDKITIIKTGVYKVNGTVNMISGTNNVVVKGAVFVNNVEQNQSRIHRKIATSGDVGSASFTGLLNIESVPVDIDFRMMHDNVGSVDITLTDANIVVEKIDEV